MTAALQGKLKQIKDAKGNLTTFAYNGNGYLQTVARTDGTTTDELEYTYISGGDNDGKLASVTLEHNNTAIRSLVYGYYDSSNTDEHAHGRQGDLMSVMVTDGATNAAVVDTAYYRYWKTGDTNFSTKGYSGALKMILGSDSIERALADTHDVLGESVADSTLVGYADTYLEYDPATRQVKLKTVQSDG